MDTLTRTLTKADVVNMLRGTLPCGDEMKKALDMGIGEYYGGQDDHFEWCNTWEKVWDEHSTQELYDLYCEIEIDNNREDVDKLYSVWLAYWDTGIDPGVEGVFSTQEKAAQFAKEHSGLTVSEYRINEGC